MSPAAMRVIIDTDPGIDDAAAILFALQSPVLQVEAITTVFGNVEVEQCTRNALTILEVAGRNGIPVHPGSARPLTRRRRRPDLTDHGCPRRDHSDRAGAPHERRGGPGRRAPDGA